MRILNSKKKEVLNKIKLPIMEKIKNIPQNQTIDHNLQFLAVED
jgi:hypothetical protein